jgi:hypothetical protein
MLLTLLLLSPAVTHAEQAKHFGKYVVHYNALQTSFLLPKIAREYGIKRSAQRIMLNISVLEKLDDTATKAVSADVWVTANSLSGQQRQISMRPIHEGDSIYYIGELDVADRETLIFDINVKPAGEKTTYPLKYSKQFYTK